MAKPYLLRRSKYMVNNKNKNGSLNRNTSKVYIVPEQQREQLLYLTPNIYLNTIHSIICAYIRARTPARSRTNTRMHSHTRTHTQTHVQPHARMDVSAPASAHTRTPTRARTCRRPSIHMRTLTRAHPRTHTRSHYIRMPEYGHVSIFAVSVQHLHRILDKRSTGG